MKALFESVRDHGPLCVGLDPNIDKIPHIEDHGHWVLDGFCYNLLKVLQHVVKIVKFQIAYFEAAGANGLTTLCHLIDDAKRMGYYVILDAKRSDISTTAEAYAKAAFDIYNADALTILPFMGEKSIRTFVDYARKKDRQIFVVVYPTEMSVYSNNAINTLGLVQSIGDENINNGYGDVGAVVSGVMPNHIDLHRQAAPRVFFLVPGMGSQGGEIKEQIPAFKNKNGVVLNYSRSVIYSDDPLKVVKDINDEIASIV
jgi:orotidine-5'-phosphate decarboxylase